MRYFATTTTVSFLVALIIAAPLTAGAADTADKAKEKAQTTTQEAKTMVTDSWVTSKVKILIFADERVKVTQISVDTTKGAVHLRGKVDSAEAKSAASEIAQGTDGVKSVKNYLQVVAPTARKAVDASDSDIKKVVETRLSRDTQLKKVDVRTDAGVVTLTGQVATIVASAKASEMARGVSGVRAVKNELTFTR
jgi:hyperosmotically inducible periplasmic protein